MTRPGHCPARRHILAHGPRAAVTLELILALPIWLIALLAVIEFGFLIAHRQQLALASRVGAEEASITPGLAATLPGGPVPANVIRAIQQQLQSSCITPCKVILEHNAASLGPPPALPVALVSGPCNFNVAPPVCAPPGCDCPAPPPAGLPVAGTYVRVTVYVRLTELAPNLLKPFGMDLSERFLGNSTTFRYELD